MMDPRQVSTSDVEAQDICVQSEPHAFAGMGTLGMQSSFAPIMRRDLMAAVNTVARDHGLRPATLVVLDALLSCLPCRNEKTGKDQPITPSILLTVFASNDTLCWRAKGITDRQLRRHLDTLERVGFLTRRDSANGKRFPIYRSGKIVGAFGLDLSPLLMMSADLLKQAQKHREEQEELRGLKSCILALRNDCLDLTLTEAQHSFVDGLRNVLRRVGLTVHEARHWLSELHALKKSLSISKEAAPLPTIETNQTSACDSQNVRHKEPENSDTKKTNTPKPMTNSLAKAWATMTTLPQFFEKMPGTTTDVLRVIHSFGPMVGLGQQSLCDALSRTSKIDLLLLLDQIAAKLDRIEAPDRYLQTILRNQPRREVGHGQLWPTGQGA